MGLYEFGSAAFVAKGSASHIQQMQRHGTVRLHVTAGHGGGWNYSGWNSGLGETGQRHRGRSPAASRRIHHPVHRPAPHA